MGYISFYSALLGYGGIGIVKVILNDHWDISFLTFVPLASLDREQIQTPNYGNDHQLFPPCFEGILLLPENITKSRKKNRAISFDKM